jgi:hypothetical protein
MRSERSDFNFAHLTEAAGRKWDLAGSWASFLNFHHEINTSFFSSIALALDGENNRTRRD